MDYLRGRNGFIVTLYKFIAFSKATFSEELSFDVLTIRNLAVRMLYSLLNNLIRLLVALIV